MKGKRDFQGRKKKQNEMRLESKKNTKKLSGSEKKNKKKLSGSDASQGNGNTRTNTGYKE